MAPAYVESLGGCSGVGPLRPEKTLGECPRGPAGEGVRPGSGVVGERPESVLMWPDAETALEAQAIFKKSSGVGYGGITARRRCLWLVDGRPAVRTGLSDLVKGGILVDAMSSKWLALSELLLNGLVLGDLAEVCSGEGARSTGMGFGVRRSVAIR